MASMAETPLYVLDASSALSAHFQDDPGRNDAVQVMADFSGGWVNLIAPHQLAYEFATVSRRYILQGDISVEQGCNVYLRFLSFRIPLLNPEGLLATAYNYSFRYPITYYDALYLALAQIEGSQVITCDRPFFEAMPA